MEGCDRCSNSWGCSRCSSGYYLDTLTSSTGTCSQTCPSGSIPNPVTRTCITSAASAVSSCGTNCLLCVASTSCSQCQSPYLLENGVCKSSCSSTNPIAFNKTCVSTCPPGYVNIQAATNTCAPCDPSCLKCSNSAANGCLTCKNGSFLHNGMCLPCNSSCETCLMDTNHCTSCPHGTYLLGSTCVLVCPDISIESNRTCAELTSTSASALAAVSECLSPMTWTSTGSCVFCGGNCAECSSDTQTCLVCNPGLVFQNGVCTIPGSQSSATFQSGAITSIETLSLLQYSTSQTVLVGLSQEIDLVNQTKVFWILFAKDIAPDFTTLSCGNIQEMVTNNATQGFPQSILQMGASGLEYVNYTDSYGVYLSFTGLRAALNYNYTICTQQFSTAPHIWDSGSIEFKTKDNGYAIRKFKLTMDTYLPSEDLSSFLCALTSALSVSNSTITTSEGYSCNSEKTCRLLDEQQSTLRILNSNRRTLASESTNQLDLLVYGDPTSETIDSTTTQIIEKLSSKSFMDSFVYSSSSTTTVSSKGTVKISEVSIGQSIIPEAPKLVTETVSYEVKGNIMFFPNITFSGVDGYAYICLVPNNPQTSDISPSSALILSTSKSTSQSTDDYIIEKIRFFNGEALAVLIEEINPNTTYNIVISGTNEDQSNFAFRTPRVLIQAILGTSLPEGSVGFSSFIFIATEIGAVVFLIVTWLGLFSKIKIKFHKCRRCLRPKPSHVKAQKIQVIRNKDGPTNPQFDLKNASTIIELQADESLRRLGSTQAKSLNPSLVCLEKLGERAGKVNPGDINPLSLSQIPLAEGQSLSNIYVHKVDVTLLEVPDEVQDFKISRR